MKKRMYDMVMLLAGAFIFALAVNLFVIPNDFGEGGVTGISIVLYYLFQWSPALVGFVINGILLVIGYRLLDKQTTYYTIIVVAFNSLFLHWTEDWSIPADEPVLNAIFAGLLAGLGIGLIIRVGGTTAGTTILARLANKYLDWNISYALLFFDIIVAILSIFVIGIENFMFTILILYIGTKAMEFIIEGLNPKKAVTIVSAKHNAIASKVTDIMDRGVSVLRGYGYYTGQEKEILYIVISKQEVSMLKKIVKSEDPSAFVTIHDVRDVFGEGFIDISK
ncbi:YitT family protein [Paenibacillus urinalis]|uniref:YitT family protein n=1 Tax=Paenibacillus urinalis TaxID=521520 RepID=A0AAX3MWH4_9BACL|nr:MULTISPECIES: YitT family protein [Paenibacillus]WDH81687.1 YitT family protein [Paenibacillus urinalis]WDH97731.1 YitT family protein [Paenibacillus urinalis]WDI01407.1 YitT family protein [Paenibacillus urinalis]GAK42189.1 efflux transporter [Paenibacillus sp. TCA20]